jgi:hypothetical protein
VHGVFKKVWFYINLSLLMSICDQRKEVKTL